MATELILSLARLGFAWEAGKRLILGLLLSGIGL
jgi:hypothetical protein